MVIGGFKLVIFAPDLRNYRDCPSVSAAASVFWSELSWRFSVNGCLVNSNSCKRGGSSSVGR